MRYAYNSLATQSVTSRVGDKRLGLTPSRAAVIAVGLAAVLGLSVELPGLVPQPSTAAPAVPAAWTWQGPVPIADAVDWDAVEVSPNPSPLAVAAYEP